MGLIFFKKVCSDIGILPEVIDEIDTLKEVMLSNLTEKAVDIARAKFKTEADLVMEDVGLMCQMTINGNTNWLENNTHYVINGNRIYFDTAVMFVNYKLYKNSCREKLIIDTVEQFRQLVGQETYLITDHSVDGSKALRMSRAILELDMAKMTDKGLDISMYG
jgi:hypothetical protein